MLLRNRDYTHCGAMETGHVGLLFGDVINMAVLSILYVIARYLKSLVDRPCGAPIWGCYRCGGT